MPERCKGCPFAGRCTPCRPQTTEVFKVFKIKDYIGNSAELPGGTIFFNKGREPLIMRRNEKTCPKCSNNATTCFHQGLLAA